MFCSFLTQRILPWAFIGSPVTTIESTISSSFEKFMTLAVRVMTTWSIMIRAARGLDSSSNSGTRDCNMVRYVRISWSSFNKSYTIGGARLKPPIKPHNEEETLAPVASRPTIAAVTDNGSIAIFYRIFLGWVTLYLRWWNSCQVP